MSGEECPSCGAYVDTLYCEFCGERMGPRRGGGPETRVQALERSVRRLEDCLSAMAEKNRRVRGPLTSGRTPKPPLKVSSPKRDRLRPLVLPVIGVIALAVGVASLWDALPKTREEVVESGWGRTRVVLEPAVQASLPTARMPRLAVVQASAAAPGLPVSRSSVPEADRRKAVRHWHNGIIFFQRGDYAEARDEWLLCKAFDPGSDDCSTGLARIDSSYGGL